MERALQKYVISPLAKEILGKRVVKGDIITVDIIDNQLIFQK
ncbi:MAG: hypothetical protein LBD75_04380 [Candidatus Peribacteria bacterium]|nr:hypothetical protein [Candidatus Peribacteria bacterium]